MVNIDKIKKLADEKGIKLSYLASMFGLGRSYFTDIKKRNGDISDDRLIIIADKLDTTVEYLRDQTEKKTKERGIPAIADMSPEEIAYIQLIRKLTPENRKFLFNAVAAQVASKQENKSEK